MAGKAHRAGFSTAPIFANARFDGRLRGGAVDVTIVLDVYAAGEAPITGADGRAIARAVRSRGSVEPVFVESLNELLPVLDGLVEDGDLVLTMGAGDIGAYAAGLPDLLRNKPNLKVHS